MKKVTLNQYNRAKQIIEKYEQQTMTVGDSRDLRDCDLPVRVFYALRAMDFKYVSDVRKYYKKHGGNYFFRIRGIGRKSIHDIRLLLGIDYDEFHKSR